MFVLALLCLPFGGRDFVFTLNVLASDSLQGRRAGTPYERKAAEFLSRELRGSGIVPLMDSGYFQTFEVSLTLGYDTARTRAWLITPHDTVELLPGKDFVPLSFSSSGEEESALQFAGYGITTRKYRYDDYHGSDVTDKGVVVFRHEPREKDPKGLFGTPFPSLFSDLRYKARNAREHGARAVILVTDPLHQEDELVAFPRNVTAEDAGILALQIRREILAPYIPFDSLHQAIENDLNPHPYEPESLRLKVRIAIERKSLPSRNVLAVIPGKEPASGWIVLGAHYDHLGLGGPGSGALDPDTLAPHNGADDNASGVAMVLALARYLARHPLRHNVLVAFWGAEEIGALGSAHFVKHMPIPKESVLVYVNFDMVGRLNDEGRLVVTGSGTAREFDSLFARVDTTGLGLSLEFSPEGFGGSDHMNFYTAGIPVTFFFTGVHEDYHRITDDVDRINLEGMARVATYALRFLKTVDRLDHLTYQETGGRMEVQTGDRRMKVRLGIIPDYTFQGPGVRVTGVRKGGPADFAGIQKGDVFLAFDGDTLEDLYAYMSVLSDHNWGDTLRATVVRNGDTLQILLPLIRKQEEAP